MGITYKLILKKQNSKEDGSCPIAVRMTIDRKTRIRSLGQLVHPDNWNDKLQNVRKTAPNYEQLSIFCDSCKNAIQNAILTLQNRGIAITFEELNRLLNEGEPENDFLKFIAKELNTAGKYAAGTAKAYKNKFKRLQEFRSSINIHKMDYNFLNEYKRYLEQRGVMYSTVHAHLKFIRAMCNEAIKQGVTENYPFKDFALKEPKASRKEFLDKHERNKLMELLDSQSLPGYLQKTLHYFLIACYTGLRDSDWRQCRNIKGDVILVKQTKKGGEELRIPLNKYSRVLIETLPETYHVFTNQRNNVYLKEIKQLAGIEKHLTTHCGRHTFIVMCLNEAKIPIEVVAEFVGDKVKTLEKHYAQYLDFYKVEEMSKLDAI